jgi:energy-converting hydrogenase Eha subunit A
MATATMPRTTAELVRNARRTENIFFSGMAVLILVTVFVGFARTYFLAGMVRAHLPSPIIHIHGAVFSLWVLLLITQTSLVSAGRTDIHRKLGLAGFALACLMPVLGVLAATNSLSRNFAPPGFPLGAQTFYVIPMADMLIFSTLVFFAFRARRTPAVHKRLILIATIALMDAPTGRPPFSVLTGHAHMDVLFPMIFLLPVVAYDLWSTHTVQRATIWAGLFLIVVAQLRVPIGTSGVWHSFATWAQRLG